MAVPMYLIDTENTTFQPRSCNEAIILFNRMKQKNQIQWDYVPELLQRISANLGPEDHDRFCEWICNPREVKPGAPGYFAQLCQGDEADPGPGPEEDEKMDLDIPESSGLSFANHTTACDNCTHTVIERTSDVQHTQPAQQKL